MPLQTVLNSRLGIGVALSLGRVLPPRVGYRLAYFIANRISSLRNLTLVKAVRANQWIVNNKKLNAQQLDEAVQKTFCSTAHSIYDLYHYINNPQASKRLIKYGPNIKKLLDQCQEGKDGVIIVGVHMSNFDFVGQATAKRGLRALTLAVSDPGGGYKWQYRMRNKSGLGVVPASKSAIREAIERLRNGGTVVTGIDRPLPNSKYHPHFFGQPAAMPVMHIYLALKAKVPIVVAAAIMQPDSTYYIESSEHIQMVHHSVRHTEMIINAEAVLNIAANFIRQAPHQWAMFFPVWPEVIAEMP